MKSQKSRVEKARESLDVLSRSRPMGPRTKKWNAELDAKLTELKKLEPGCDAFNKIVDRIMTINRAMRCRRWREINSKISEMFDPAITRKATELERLLDDADRGVSVNVGWSQWKNGWFPSGYVATSLHQSLPHELTAESLSGQVAAILRSEAEKLIAMADGVSTAKDKTPGKRRAVA